METEGPSLTVEARSEEAARGRPVNSATAEPAVWAEAAAVSAEAAAAVEAAGAGGNHPRKRHKG